MQKRRLVSVMFLDVVGSTALSRTLDPEDVHELMDGLLARGTELVQQHGGAVLQYAGDSLLAAFGAKLTREDDAECAVRCGLALLDEGERFGARVLSDHGHAGVNVRVGVHTGLVLLGGGVDEEGTIRGFTVNIAARMEQHAPAGRLRISQNTWRQVSGRFEAEAQPPLAVKGGEEPLATHLVLRERPAGNGLEGRGVEGVRAPLLGREAELALLQDELAQAQAGCGLRAVTVLAEAGVGKSRLVQEFVQAMRDGPWRVLAGRATLRTTLQPYALLRDMVSHGLKLADTRSPAAAQEQLRALMPGSDDDAATTADALSRLLGWSGAADGPSSALQGRALRERALSGWRSWVHSIAGAARMPVLLLEDLHWADEASLDALSGLASHDRALLMVMTARPDLLQRRADWLGRQVALQPLAAAESDTLAQALLQRCHPASAALKDLLLQRAQGNPYAMEELLKMLIDDGVIAAVGDTWQVHDERLQSTRVPTTLTGVLQARMEALAEPDRRALQQASIVGPVFWHDALAALDPMAPQSLPALERRALVRPSLDSVFEGTSEEVFNHQLQQQVTYDTVLKAERRAGHARAAEWLAQRVDARAIDLLAATAEHFELAGDIDRAYEFYGNAARDAQRRYANATAMELARRALALPGLHDPQRRMAMLRLQSNLADLTGNLALQEDLMRQRSALAEASGDGVMRAGTHVGWALLAARRNDYAESLRQALQALALAEPGGSAVNACLAHNCAGSAHYMQGDLKQARWHATRSVHWGEVAAAEMQTERDGMYLAQALHLAATVALCSDELVEAVVLSERAAEAARTAGLRREETIAREVQGVVACALGQWTEAAGLLRQALDGARAVGSALFEASALRNLASVDLATGAASAALQRLDAAHRIDVRIGDRRGQATCELQRSDVLRQLGDGAGALAAARQALSTFEAVGLAPMQHMSRAAIAELLLEAGENGAAQCELAGLLEACGGQLSLAHTEDPLRLHVTCWRLLHAAADPRAHSVLVQARALLQQRAARVLDPVLRQGLLQGQASHRTLLGGDAGEGVVSPR